MNDTKWISEMVGKRHLDLSLSEADAVQKMLIAGDLMHIDGAFIQALADLSDSQSAAYRGVDITRDEHDRYIVSVDECADSAGDAIEALMRADEHLSGKHPLPEPEPASDGNGQEAYRRQMIDAGRGHLLGGAS